MGFFIQSILADRYIHRRELRLVSLESLSSVEHGKKTIFFDFRFLQGVIEVCFGNFNNLLTFFESVSDFCL